MIDDEAVSWLDALIRAYRELYDECVDKGSVDKDPGATEEMLAACRDLAAELRKQLPPPDPRPVGTMTDEDRASIPF